MAAQSMTNKEMVKILEDLDLHSAVQIFNEEKITLYIIPKLSLSEFAERHGSSAKMQFVCFFLLQTFLRGVADRPFPKYLSCLLIPPFYLSHVHFFVTFT